jgi:hypothetical protein
MVSHGYIEKNRVEKTIIIGINKTETPILNIHHILNIKSNHV